MAKKNNGNKKKASLGSVLKKIATIAAGVFIGAIALSFIGVLFGPVAAAYIVNIATIGAIASSVALAGTGAVALGNGLVNAFKWIFSKKYREQVRQKKLDKNRSKEQEKEQVQEVEKEQVQEVEKEQVQEVEKEQVKDEVKDEVKETEKAPTLDPTGFEPAKELDSAPEKKGPEPEKEPAPTPTQTPTDADIYKKIQTKDAFTNLTLSARESVALQKLFSEEKKIWTAKVKQLSSIENPTEVEVAKLEEAKLNKRKFTKLEKGAYDIAMSKQGGAPGQSSDSNSTMSDEERELLNDFSINGRKSKKVKNMEITDEDLGKAYEVMDDFDKLVEAKKSGKKGR